MKNISFLQNISSLQDIYYEKPKYYDERIQKWKKESKRNKLEQIVRNNMLFIKGNLL